MALVPVTDGALDQISAIDPTWARIKKHLEREIGRLREQNDTQLEPLQTAALRGRIAAVKDLLALPDKLAAQAAMHEPIE